MACDYKPMSGDLEVKILNNMKKKLSSLTAEARRASLFISMKMNRAAAAYIHILF